VNGAYAGHKPRLIVITTPDAVSTLEGKVSSAHLDRIADTDFSSWWVAVVYQGKRMMTDYDPIVVSDVRREGNVVVIYAQFQKSIGSLNTSPYYILRIEKPAGMDEEELTLALHAEGQVVPQICAVQGEHISWEKMAFDRGGDRRWSYEGLSPHLAIIPEQDAISFVQHQLPPQHLELVSRVDFSTHFVAIIYQGEKLSTGYAVEVVDVKRQDDTIFVCSQLHDPHPGEVRGALVTSPYYVMEVESPEDLRDNFSFVLLDNGKEVARQESLAPLIFESPLPSPTPWPTISPDLPGSERALQFIAQRWDIPQEWLSVADSITIEFPLTGVTLWRGIVIDTQSGHHPWYEVFIHEGSKEILTGSEIDPLSYWEAEELAFREKHGEHILELVARREDISTDDLEIAIGYFRQNPRSGQWVWQGKVIDMAPGGEIYRIAVDEQHREIDVQELEEAFAEAARTKYGKLDRTLFYLLRTMELEEMVKVILRVKRAESVVAFLEERGYEAEVLDSSRGVVADLPAGFIEELNEVEMDDLSSISHVE